jgi:hypothetical protein
MLNNNNGNTKIKASAEDSDQPYWNTWYLGVLLFLLAQIIIFYWITKSFS